MSKTIQTVEYLSKFAIFESAAPLAKEISFCSLRGWAEQPIAAMHWRVSVRGERHQARWPAFPGGSCSCENKDVAWESTEGMSRPWGARRGGRFRHKYGCCEACAWWCCTTHMGIVLHAHGVYESTCMASTVRMGAVRHAHGGVAGCAYPRGGATPRHART